VAVAAEVRADTRTCKGRKGVRGGRRRSKRTKKKEDGVEKKLMIAGACSALGAEMRVMQEGRRAIDKPEVWLTQQRGGRRGRGCEKLDPGTTMACSLCPFYVQSIQYPKVRMDPSNLCLPRSLLLLIPSHIFSA
jgi:hypothetical protein